MIIKLIQEKIPIGNEIKILLKDGQQIAGTLEEIGRLHITIESQGRRITILEQMIGGWEEVVIVSNGPPIPAEVPAEIFGNELDKLIDQFESEVASYPSVLQLKLGSPAFELFSEDKQVDKQAWEKIRSQFAYAIKINELGKKFARAQKIKAGLEDQMKRQPFAFSIKLNLAQLLFMMGEREQAILYLQEIALLRSRSNDWLNLASASYECGDEGQTICSLERYLLKEPVSQNGRLWSTYCRLLIKQNGYPNIANMIAAGSDAASDEHWEKVLIVTLYCLTKGGKRALALGLLSEFKNTNKAYEALSTCSENPDIQTCDVLLAIESKLGQRKQDLAIDRGDSAAIGPKGNIIEYKSLRNFGFIHGNSGKQLFFHRSAVVDDLLLKKLSKADLRTEIPVVFKEVVGAKGFIAVDIMLHRSISECNRLAYKFADTGNYRMAVQLLRQVLDMDPNYPGANDQLKKWSKLTDVCDSSRGTDVYARAKRAHLVEKDLDKAEALFIQSVENPLYRESAIKDLAHLLIQLGRNDDALRLLKEKGHFISDKSVIESISISIHENAGNLSAANVLLEKRLSRTVEPHKKTIVLWQIANNHFRLNDFEKAESTFAGILRIQPDNIPAKRNIALCRLKQGDLSEAEDILSKVLLVTNDQKSLELLEQIKKAAASGTKPSIDPIVVESALSDSSSGISGLTVHLLGKCSFRGVDVRHIRAKDGKKIYDASPAEARADIRALVDIATEHQTIRPSERYEYYLSAARIIQDLDFIDIEKYYRFLCKALASYGDHLANENVGLDIVRDAYCESLALYDSCRQQAGEREEFDEQDAVHALTKYMYSILGWGNVLKGYKYIQKDLSKEEILNRQKDYIAQTILDVFERHSEPATIFDSIGYISSNSVYAANRVLDILFIQSPLRSQAIDYLRKTGAEENGDISTKKQFIDSWKTYSRKKYGGQRAFKSELRNLQNYQFSTAWLETSHTQVGKFLGLSFLATDNRRLREILDIIEISADLCRQTTFEEKERLCNIIIGRCQELMKEIDVSPTKLSIEEYLPIIKAIKDKVTPFLAEIYETLKPMISLRIPIESYTPDESGIFDVQIVIENRAGKSPAEALELIIQEEEDFFESLSPEQKIAGSLRGGAQKIINNKIRISEKTSEQKTFSLSAYCQYRTRTNEVLQTNIESFSIRLYRLDEFREIDNPYAEYAEGGVVGNPEMFYGRADLIINIQRAITKSTSQSKGIIIYGQKRAGKSSILFHLKAALSKEEGILVLDVGNIGSILDAYAKVPLLYQILWVIISKLRYGIEDLVSSGFDQLGIEFPDDRDFYSRPSPLTAFRDIFDRFGAKKVLSDTWHNVPVVVLIDEFSYIYEKIVSGEISPDFMKNWKALMQEHYFSVVLAGQDVMLKFKQRFPNEFGIMQDERVSYLKNEDAIKLIDEPLKIDGKSGESRFRERAIDHIIGLTAGSPFYIQMLCNRLVEHMNRRHASLVTEADVEKVKLDLIEGVNKLSLDKFDNLISSGDNSASAIPDEDTLKVLRAVGANSQTAPCNRNALTCETKFPIDEILEDLVRRDVLSREHEHYYDIKIGLFKDWLTSNP